MHFGGRCHVFRLSKTLFVCTKAIGINNNRHAKQLQFYAAATDVQRAGRRSSRCAKVLIDLNKFESLMNEQFLRDEIIEACHAKMMELPEDKLKLINTLIQGF